MQQSVLDTLPRARVTRSTANFGNHYLSRAAREGSQAVTWGQFIALRAMFGPAVCFRYEWAGRLAERYPLAREDAYEGVIPDKVTVQDVLDGKAGMPVARRRKVSIMTLAPERSRKRGPTGKRKANAEAEAEREDWLADLKREESMAAEEGGEDEVGKVGEDVWNEAAASAGRMDPAAAIAKMKEKYRAQEAEVKRLRASNDGIRRALMAFTNMAAMAQKT
ncbi:hypothetical protein PWT90_08542 [Aphanocladium album]|nr:hypothetical protein PWT90_08542 [Aphanocladium album]